MALRKLPEGVAAAAGFAARTTAVALLALIIAATSGLHHPWWAAMTVLLVGQPTPGLLLERAVARLTGTMVGGGVGYAILHTLGGMLGPTLVVLTAWLGFCAAGGSVFRHFRSYAFVLAGYSAAIVVLFRLMEGGAGPIVAADRVLCTMLGVVVAALSGLVAMRRAGTENIAMRFAEVRAAVFDQVELYLATGTTPPVDAIAAAVITLEQQADDMAAGSLSRRRVAQQVRWTAGLLLELLALTSPRQEDAQASRPPDGVGDAGLARIAALHAAATFRGEWAMAVTLDKLRSWLDQPSRWQRWRWQWATFSVQRTWRAALRPVVAMAIAATGWLATGWSAGAMMTMTAALFASLFSSHSRGGQAMRHVLAGSCVGVVVGALYKVVVLPHVTGILPVALALTPVLIAGVWLMRSSATDKMAIDLTLCFLLVSQPYSGPMPVAVTLSVCAAIMAGVGVAATVFWFILPSHAVVRTRAPRQRQTFFNSHERF